MKIIESLQHIVLSTIEKSIPAEGVNSAVLADAIVKAIEDDLAGQQIYIPIRTMAKDQKARYVYTNWDTTPHSDLIKYCKCSFNHLYRLYKLGRKLANKDRQTDLFPQSE